MSDPNIILNNLGIPDNNWTGSFRSEGLFGVESPGSSTRRIDIKLNDTSIASIVGPTPFIDISRTYQNDDGYLGTIIENITLNGKIVPNGTGVGFVPIMSKISELKELIQRCAVGKLEVLCNNVSTYVATGVIVKQFTTSKTEDNWTRTADFTLELEQKLNGKNELKTVEDKAESWTIEPIEDSPYVNFNQQLDNINSEYLSPNMVPRSPGRNNGVPAGSVNGPNQGMSLGIKTLGQYRITRRLSAKGLAIDPTNANCSIADENTANNIRLKNARNWVETKSISHHFGGSGTIVIPSLNNLATVLSDGSTHLYNHTRTTAADIYNGTFEMTDNWIAMPAGTHHTESFSMDCSTSNNFTKTIRVAGTVNGMALHNHNAYANNSLIPNNTIDLYPAAQNTNKTANTNSRSPSSVDNGISTANTISPHKYVNAKNAWEQEIRPYIYRRACLGMSQNGKIQRAPVNAIDPNNPENPTFLIDRPLNTIPVNTTEGHDPIKGVITYNYEFNNQYKVIPGVISENINVVHDIPADNVTEVAVLGRTQGPLIQSIGKTSARKTLTIDLVVQPPLNTLGTLPGLPTCPIGVNTELRTYIQAFVDGHTPFYARDAAVFGSYGARGALQGTVFVQSDQETWNPTDGRFSKTVTWVYQPCNVNWNSLYY